ncbi:MAG: O-antigen ligase family protein [Paeniclostridium sordellii]|nr:O-antigen ligase family protein [Paeniclostridium sordellii]
MDKCSTRSKKLYGDKFKNNKNDNISFFTYSLSLMILLVFICRDKYFNIGNYYFYIIASIIIGTMGIAFKIATTKKIKKPRLSDYCYISIIIYSIIITYLLGHPFKADTVITYVILCLLILVVNFTMFNRKEVNFIINIYIISALILAIMQLLQWKMPYPGQIRFSVFYSDLEYYDVNFLAAYMLVPGSIAFNKAINLKNKIKKNKYFFASGIIVMSIFLTGSRAGAIGTIISFTLILLINKKINIKTILWILLLILIIYIIIPDEIINRFFVNSYNDGSNGRRVEHWKYGWALFKQNPFWGYGLTWTSEALAIEYNYYSTVHNTFIAMLIQFGIIGITPIIILLINLVIKLLKKGEKNMLGPIIGLIFSIIMIEAQTSLLIYIPIIIISIVINNKSTNNIEQLR